MLLKTHETPIGLQICTALLNRLPSNSRYFSKVKNTKSSYYSGLQGEKTLQYYLSFNKAGSYSIVNDLRLNQHHKFFQIDSLILTPKFILLVEVKNMDGVIRIDEKTGQMTRVKNGREEVFKDPISQVTTQSFLLQDWLMERRIYNVPIRSLVAFTHPSANLKIPSYEARIIHAHKLSERIHSLESHFKEEVLSLRKIHDLTEEMKKLNTPLIPNILKNLGIKPEDLLRGVNCLDCKKLGMIRNNGWWYCTSCKKSDRYAHIYALRDHYLLVGNEISTKDARWWLGIESGSTVRKLLNNTPGVEIMSRGKFGENIYKLNFEYDVHFEYLEEFF